MSSRKIDTTLLTQKSTPEKPQRVSSTTATGVPTHVICKLLGFTLAMVLGPIGCYFVTLNNIFGGNTTYAGATAAFTANLILFGYIIVAFREDRHELSEGSREKKIN